MTYFYIVLCNGLSLVFRQHTSSIRLHLKAVRNLLNTHCQLPVEGFLGAEDFLEGGGAVSFV